jgi:hypothetical protein
LQAEIAALITALQAANMKIVVLEGKLAAKEAGIVVLYDGK